MLEDQYARKFSYLRLSVTEACTFRCRYCLPEGYRRAKDREPDLSLSEISNLLYGFRRAGFTKLRVTGGEPTLRKDLFEILNAGTLSGFSKIALSTNGWNLRKIAPRLRAVGVTHLNVSLDSLDPSFFAKLTGRNLGAEVLAGLDVALKQGFSSVKVNAVLHRDSAKEEFLRFLDFVRDREVTVRFIELMKTRDRAEYRDAHFFSSAELRLDLLKKGWTEVPRAQDAGPAVEFKHPQFLGRMGLIAPHAEGFCSSCNRLRVDSLGRLRLCLFGDRDLDLRHHLQSPESAIQLPGALASLLMQKALSHGLLRGEVGNLAHFSTIGG